MKLLISGASGNFGGQAVAGLLKQVPANDLILISRKPESLSAFAEQGCTVRYGDFNNPQSMEDAAKGADKMLLISGHDVGSRVAQHSNAIDGAIKSGVRHIVYTSYFGSTADNSALVCIDHYGTEEKLKSCGVSWTALRNGMYADSIVDAAFPAAISTGRWIACAGDGKVNMTDRQDCVASAVAVMATQGHENRVYNIVGPDLLSFRDMCGIASEISGKTIEYVQISDDEFYTHLDSLGIPRDASQEFNIDGYQWCSDDMVSFEREVRNGKFEVISNDVEMLTGRAPKSFRAFADERANWLKDLAKNA